MHIPSSTYRLQLNGQFTFNDVKNIIDYLDRLGISCIYASPFFKAAPGSMHGYDITDPHRLNPEIGSELQLQELAARLKEKNMSWLQDIVPNHMAYEDGNQRLRDILERGPGSEFGDYFDINWQHPDKELKGKLLLPFLGNEMNHCLQKGEISLRFDETGFIIRYFNNSWPVSISAYHLLLNHFQSEKLNIEKETYETYSKELIHLSEQAVAGINLKEWQRIREKWILSVFNNEPFKSTIQLNVQRINSQQLLLKEILDQQYYVLDFWRITEKKINYRRFFTVNSLICLRMEDKKVFDDYHRYIHSLYLRKYLQGLRIDHIDGLYDPAEYIDRLRKLVGEECYIIAEKILAPNEELPADWKLQGTSGYEFLSDVSRLLTNQEGAQQLVEYYREQIGNKKSYAEIAYEKKLFILLQYMQGELDNLLYYFEELKLLPAGKRPDKNLKKALAVLMAAFPVYRIYPGAFPIDRLKFVEQAFQKALQKSPELKGELEIFQRLFEIPPHSSDEGRSEILFLKRLMQFTGPLAAKGVEDTTFYLYNPLISHNEVGDAPGKLSIGLETFHRKMMIRKQHSAFSLNTTSTHDTKRGEDARLRINVLSEIAGEWQKAVNQWRSINQPLKKNISGKSVPALNEEYFIYQSMLGGFPANLPQLKETTGKLSPPGEEDIKRLKEYIQKFLREEKLYTDWAEPDEAYEEACFSFIDGLFNEQHAFLSTFIPFVNKVISYASVYSLGQALIKLTAPGIPDTYQGCELWDLSYVDPDNRRPIDYNKRIKFLDTIIKKENQGSELFGFLEKNRNEGVEKMYVTYKSLNFRKKHPDLFIHGEYLPLKIEGGEKDALAYARVWNGEWAVIVIPLDLVNKMKAGENLPDKKIWKDLKLQLPSMAPQLWTNEFTGGICQGKDSLLLSEIFSMFPVALLH